MRGALKRGIMGLLVAFAFFAIVEGGLRIALGPPAPQRLIRKTWAADGEAFAVADGKVSTTYQGPDAIEPFDAAPTEGVVRIFGFGESSMRGGSGIGPEREFMGLMGKALNAEGIKVEVQNLARPGLDSHTLRPVLREGLVFKPDIVVFYVGHNDVGNGTLEARYGDIQGALAARTLVGMEQFQLYTQLHRMLVPRPPNVQFRPGLTPTQRDVLEIDYRSNLRWMVHEVEQAGATPVLITPASPLDGWFSQRPSCSDVVPNSAWVSVRNQWVLTPNMLTSRQIQSAIDLAPDCPDVLYLKGILLLREGKRDEAWRALSYARDHEPFSLRASSGIVGAVRQVADEEDLPLVDWEAWLRTGDQQTRYFTDNVHLQPDAHQALAKLMAPTVKAAIEARQDE